jgi:hypothetical protein
LTQPDLSREIAENHVHAAIVETRLGDRPEEEDHRLLSSRIGFVAEADILAEHGTCLWGQRHEQALIKLGAPDREQSLCEVHILRLETECFGMASIAVATPAIVKSPAEAARQ